MPAGNTYESIATQTLGSAAATVTFSSIPGTYTDLVLVSAGSNSALNDIKLRFNSDTGNNYSETLLLGSGSSAITARGSNISGLVHNYTDSSIASATTNILNYSNSTTNKTTLTRWNATSSSDPYVAAYVGLWRNTAAITSITVFVASGTMSTGSTFSLYGIKAA
jgi:hypothetical protein